MARTVLPKPTPLRKPRKSGDRITFEDESFNLNALERLLGFIADFNIVLTDDSHKDGVALPTITEKDADGKDIPSTLVIPFDAIGIRAPRTHFDSLTAPNGKTIQQLVEDYMTANTVSQADAVRALVAAGTLNFQVPNVDQLKAEIDALEGRVNARFTSIAAQGKVDFLYTNDIIYFDPATPHATIQDFIVNNVSDPGYNKDGATIDINYTGPDTNFSNLIETYTRFTGT